MSSGFDQYFFLLLYARLELRDYFSEVAAAEIYDNIGQVLSLVRVKMATLAFQGPDLIKEETQSAQHLVGKAIADLRQLCPLFQPENLLADHTSFIREATALLKHKCPQVPVDVPADIPPLKGPDEKYVLNFFLFIKMINLIAGDYSLPIQKISLTIYVNEVQLALTVSGTIPGQVIQSDALKPYGISLSNCLKLAGATLSVNRQGNKITNLRLQTLIG